MKKNIVVAIMNIVITNTIFKYFHYAFIGSLQSSDSHLVTDFIENIEKLDNKKLIHFIVFFYNVDIFNKKTCGYFPELIPTFS